jgi:hypothetical protein
MLEHINSDEKKEKKNKAGKLDKLTERRAKTKLL